MDVDAKEVVLRPSDIRFTQSTISNKFADGSLIGELVDDVASQKCFISDIKKIEVKLVDGFWFSGDNRRLWVFKQLEFLGYCPTVTAKVVKRLFWNKCSSKNSGLDVILRGGSPGGVWYPKILEIKERLSNNKPGVDTEYKTAEVKLNKEKVYKTSDLEGIEDSKSPVFLLESVKKERHIRLKELPCDSEAINKQSKAKCQAATKKETQRKVEDSTSAKTMNISATGTKHNASINKAACSSGKVEGAVGGGDKNQVSKSKKTKGTNRRKSWGKASSEINNIHVTMQSRLAKKQNTQVKETDKGIKVAKAQNDANSSSCQNTNKRKDTSKKEKSKHDAGMLQLQTPENRHENVKNGTTDIQKLSLKEMTHTKTSSPDRKTPVKAGVAVQNGSVMALDTRKKCKSKKKRNRRQKREPASHFDSDEQRDSCRPDREKTSFRTAKIQMRP